MKPTLDTRAPSLFFPSFYFFFFATLFSCFRFLLASAPLFFLIAPTSHHSTTAFDLPTHTGLEKMACLQNELLELCLREREHYSFEQPEKSFKTVCGSEMREPRAGGRETTKSLKRVHACMHA